MFALAVAAALLAAPTDPPFAVTVDSAHRAIVLTAGPLTIQASHGGGHAGHGAHGAAELPVLRFTMPIDGWLRGARLELRDAEGNPLPRRLVHHMNVVNFARRQLFYPAVERTLAMGQETEDIRLPSTVGVPVSRGMPMGLILAWHHEGEQDLQGVTASVVLEYLPHNQNPRPVSVFPGYMDVVDPVASPVDFDLPAGEQVFSAVHRAPVSGRIVGVGGHLHDFGTGLRLEEVTDKGDRRVITLGVKADPDGRLASVDRQLPGVRGRGVPLKAGRSYRVSGLYHNPTGQVIPKGAMVHLIMLFAPDDASEWPAVDPGDPKWQRDVRWLEERGK